MDTQGNYADYASYSAEIFESTYDGAADGVSAGMYEAFEDSHPDHAGAGGIDPRINLQAGRGWAYWSLSAFKTNCRDKGFGGCDNLLPTYDKTAPAHHGWEGNGICEDGEAPGSGYEANAIKGGGHQAPYLIHISTDVSFTPTRGGTPSTHTFDYLPHGAAGPMTVGDSTGSVVGASGRMYVYWPCNRGYDCADCGPRQEELLSRRQLREGQEHRPLPKADDEEWIGSVVDAMQQRRLVELRLPPKHHFAVLYENATRAHGREPTFAEAEALARRAFGNAAVDAAKSDLGGAIRANLDAWRARREARERRALAEAEPTAPSGCKGVAIVGNVCYLKTTAVARPSGGAYDRVYALLNQPPAAPSPAAPDPASPPPTPQTPPRAPPQSPITSVAVTCAHGVNMACLRSNAQDTNGLGMLDDGACDDGTSGPTGLGLGNDCLDCGGRCLDAFDYADAGITDCLCHGAQEGEVRHVALPPSAPPAPPHAPPLPAAPPLPPLEPGSKLSGWAVCARHAAARRDQLGHGRDGGERARRAARGGGERLGRQVRVQRTR